MGENKTGVKALRDLKWLLLGIVNKGFLPRRCYKPLRMIRFVYYIMKNFDKNRKIYMIDFTEGILPLIRIITLQDSFLFADFSAQFLP